MKPATIRQAGFTLLEMLIAIGLLTLLAGLAYGTLRMGVRGWEAADRQADQGDALRVGWPYLHQTLESAWPMPDASGKQLRFTGTRQEIQWISQLPSHLASSGPRLLRLFTDRDPRSGENQLRLSHHDIDATDLTAEDNQQAVLVERLDHITVQYFGPPAAGRESFWQGNWQQRNQLPELVRIDIQPKDAAPWPSLYAQLRLAQTVGHHQAGVPPTKVRN